MGSRTRSACISRNEFGHLITYCLAATGSSLEALGDLLVSGHGFWVFIKFEPIILQQKMFVNHKKQKKFLFLSNYLLNVL